MDIHYRHILQICHIYSHIEHHSISSFINKSSAILNVKAIDSRVNCLCALCSMCVLDEYSVRIEYSERWACCTQPLSHSPIFLSGRNIPMTTVTTTMIVMHDFINIDAIECWRWERECNDDHHCEHENCQVYSVVGIFIGIMHRYELYACLFCTQLSTMAYNCSGTLSLSSSVSTHSPFLGSLFR